MIKHPLCRLTTLLLASCVASSPALAQERLTIANYGGSYGEAMWNAIWEPLAAEMGLQISQDTLSSLADVRAQVRSGAVQWDIGELTVDECAVGSAEGLFEPLDLSPETTLGYEGSLYDDYVLVNTTSYVTAWSADSAPLSGWNDFWDVEGFPGVRSLRNDPLENVIIALLADGVPLEQAYPPDLDRAFAKLEEIRPHIAVWWGSGAQSAQLLADGEVDYIGMWSNRVQSIIDQGVEADYDFNEGILIPDCFFIPLGAPNGELARTVLTRALAADLQANVPQYIPASPVNALSYAPELISAELAAGLAASPENAARQVWTDGDWWAENGIAVRERWGAFLQQ